MLDGYFADFHDIDALPNAEQRQIMLVKKDGGVGEIERFIRRLFVWAIVNRSADVHIEGRGDMQTPEIHIHVRTPKEMINLKYTGDAGREFETKMMSLTGTPQGGSTGMAISTRFSMSLPRLYAEKHGLFPREGSDYEVDFRVEYGKTFDGFFFVSRLLDQQRTPSLMDLRLSPTLMHSILTTVQEPNGLVLVSGPTGSGKTTLLNAVLGYLNDGQRAIHTIENPVEYQLRGDGPIKQVQIKGEFTFAKALRQALRSDPETILIGEIRDEETMEIAMQAAQTGHLVLSTVHANNATATIARCIGLGADPVLLADVLKMVMAQRLLDRYAPDMQPRQHSRDELNWLDLNGMVGIPPFSETASQDKMGKAAIIEAIMFDDAVKQCVRSGSATESEIYRLASEQSQYESLASAGVRAILSHGCKLKDCMIGLGSNTDAKAHPGLRIRLAQQYRVTLNDVAMAFDQNHEARDHETPRSIEQILMGLSK